MKSRKAREKLKKAKNKKEKAKLKKKAQKFRYASERLLEKHGIQRTSSHSSYQGGSGQVSIQDRYADPSDNSFTDIWVDLYDEGDDVYTAYANWKLAEFSANFSPDNTCPPDAAAIHWNQNKWVPVSTGRDNFKWPDASGEDTSSQGEVKYDEWDTQHGGVLAWVNDPAPKSYDGKNGKFYGGFATELEAVADDASDYPIQVKYKHTYQQTSCVVSDFGVALSAGAISVSGGDPDEWTMSDSITP